MHLRNAVFDSSLPSPALPLFVTALGGLNAAKWWMLTWRPSFRRCPSAALYRHIWVWRRGSGFESRFPSLLTGSPCPGLPGLPRSCLGSLIHTHPVHTPTPAAAVVHANMAIPDHRDILDFIVKHSSGRAVELHGPRDELQRVCLPPFFFWGGG